MLAPLRHARCLAMLPHTAVAALRRHGYAIDAMRVPC